MTTLRTGKPLAAAALLGTATGLRSQMGMATLLLAGPTKSLPAVLGGSTARKLTSLFAVGEIAGDKLPNIPPRTKPPVLAARAAFGALAGGLACRAGKANVAAGAAAGAAAAVVAAFIGKSYRAAAAKKIPALAGAFIEDAVAAGLGYAGARLVA